MTSPSDRAFRTMHNTMLRAASFLVPAQKRSEWYREWQAEVWHARRSLCCDGTPSSQAHRQITAFCLGSFQDAIWLRRDLRQSGPARSSTSSTSALQCVLRLSVLLAVCIIVARLLQGVQAELDPARYQVTPGLILIDQSPSGENPVPSISVSLFRNWKAARQRYFDGFAFYRTVREPASLSRVGAWRVMHASLNLFGLLGLPVELAAQPADAGSDLPAVVLSHETWVRDFGSDPRVAGRILRFGKYTARVAGIMPYGSWRLPEKPDLWFLQPDSQLAAGLPRDGLGFLIAHFTPLGEYMMQGERVSITERGGDNDLDLHAVSFANRLHGTRGMFEFALILALLALPAVTSVTVGESAYSAHRPSRSRTLFRWSFLAAKLGLVAAIANFASLDLAYWNASTYSPLAECAQFVWCFSICLLGFRWALSDQRQRCPVCLHCVTNPAQVGLASRTFLGWNGTEMMCPGGHTLLHVPSLPTSWFSCQRWLYLDPSWEFLFADSGSW